MSVELYDWMKKKARTLGNTGLKVSPLSFGSASISSDGGGYGFGPIGFNESMSLIEKSIEMGVNLFDSAPVYGMQEAEMRLGKFFKARGGRKNIFLTSKSGVTWHPNKRINLTNDPKVTESMLLQSLKDFQTDYIDIYFIHWPDSAVDIRRPLEVLVKYQEKGAIRFLGLCNTNESDYLRSKDVAKIDVMQCEYNLFQKKVEEYILPLCKNENLGFMAWGTLEKGILSGQFHPKKALHASDNRVGAPWFKQKDVSFKCELVEKMKQNGNAIVNSKDGNPFSMMAFSLGYYFSRPEVTTLLCGSKTLLQWSESIEALKKGEHYFEGNMKWTEDEIRSLIKIADQFNLSKKETL